MLPSLDRSWTRPLRFKSVTSMCTILSMCCHMLTHYCLYILVIISPSFRPDSGPVQPFMLRDYLRMHDWDCPTCFCPLLFPHMPSKAIVVWPDTKGLGENQLYHEPCLTCSSGSCSYFRMCTPPLPELHSYRQLSLVDLTHLVKRHPQLPCKVFPKKEFESCTHSYNYPCRLQYHTTDSVVLDTAMDPVGTTTPSDILLAQLPGESEDHPVVLRSGTLDGTSSHKDMNSPALRDKEVPQGDNTDSSSERDEIKVLPYGMYHRT